MIRCGGSAGEGERMRGSVLPGWLCPVLLVLLLPRVAVAQVAAISPRRLVEAADVVGPVVSPDGKKVAFRLDQASVERNRHDVAWYVQALDGEAQPRRIADGGTPLRGYSSGLSVPELPVWTPDGQAILYRALIDGKVAVWRAATDGSGAMPVTSDPADVRDFVLSDDGRLLSYSVGATREEAEVAELAEYDDGVHIDGTVFVGAGLFRSSKLQGRAMSQRFLGNWFEGGPLLGKVESTWKQVDLATLKTQGLALSMHDMEAGTVPGHPEAWKWSSNAADGRIALLTRVGDAAGRFAKPDVELSAVPRAGSGRAVKCLSPLCMGRNITEVQWRPGSDEVLFTVTDPHEGRAQAIYRWDVLHGPVVQVVRSRGLLGGDSTQQRFQDVPCGASADVLVCVTSEADRPPRLEAIEIPTGRRTVLFDPNAALASDVAVTVQAELLRWRDAHGEEFSGWLFAAPGDRPAPLFVTYYACEGFLRGGVGDEWPLMSLAGDGISALCINGNPGYQDVVRYYDQGLYAVQSAVDMLARSGRIDPARVGMGGLSYGSEVTMWTLMQSDLLSAASIASPSLTPNWYLFNSLREAFRSGVMSHWQLGTPEETPERWRTMSPVFNLDSLNAPILFQMPEQEYLMAAEYTLPLVRMQRADMYVFPDAPHIKFQPRQKLAAYERNVDWFRFWLQDYEDPNPAKRERYVRWRAIRDARAAGLHARREEKGGADGAPSSPPCTDQTAWCSGDLPGPRRLGLHDAVHSDRATRARPAYLP